MRGAICIAAVCILFGVCGSPVLGQSQPAVSRLKASPEVVVGRAARVAVTPPLRDIAARPQPRALAPAEAREIPLGRLPRAEKPARRAAADFQDPVAQTRPALRAMPAPLVTFEGVSNLDGVHPPDPNGDVGPNHYVCMVNVHFCIYDKVTGANLIAPMLMSTLFAAAGFPPPASTSDDGDPIVLYDHLADRWLISQFIVSVTPCHEVIGISKTGDPTGEWYLYDFTMPNTKMNDYPHFGVWPDGYYMTDNQFNPDNSWGGAGVFAFDRAKMLAGDPSATYQYFDLFAANSGWGGMLPADLDGPPPPSGAPNYFAMIDDDAWGASPTDSLYLWQFHVDWATPANTTFGNNFQPNYTNIVAPFDSAFSGGRNNIPQPDTLQKLDAISDRLMHRLQYRNFGDRESLVVCHTVDADGTDHAGTRYYEARRNLPGGSFFIQEQATYAPDGDHRWMGSAAMDSYGNLAVGYSVSGTGTYPSIRYAGRMVSDPNGGLFQGEAELWAGTGSQTSTYARWGDYSMLAVDPADGVTFWYINEYLPTTSYAGWRTRIGSFRLGNPNIGALRGIVTNSLTGAGLAGARVFTTNGYAATTLAGGSYLLNLPTGTHSVAASADGFYTSAFSSVTILLNTTNVKNFGIAPIPLRITPSSSFSASGMEGGPFSPAGQTYLLSNASLASLAWTSRWSQAWLTVTPQGGALAAGRWTNLTASFNSQAGFLSAGAYSDSLVISNKTDGRAETRAASLTVTPFQQLIFCEGFDAGLPAGWAILDNVGDGAEWRFDDPGGHGNLTGGDGLFAIADSDYEGEVDMDTELRTPTNNMAGYDSLSLQFKNDFLAYSGNEIAEVDVSAHGAVGPWSNLWSRSSSVRGPGTVTLDISGAAAGQSNVMIRYHYYDAYYDNWWQVDDVCVWGSVLPNAGNLGIQPSAGLAAAGYFPGPFTPDRIYRLTNSSVAALSWTAACSQVWFESKPAGGSLAIGSSLIVTVRIAAAASALLPGAYAGLVTFSNRTEGLANTRAVDLTVTEPLVVQPSSGFIASGLEGGPFTPAGQTYLLANPSAASVAWTATCSAAWLKIGTRGGVLASMATQQVLVSLSNTLLTVPGVYTDSVVFSNLATHTAFSRAITVSVIEITGEIEVFDSVAPTNDLRIPFGTVTAGSPRIEHIMARNAALPGGRNLTVRDIFFGFYQEDFSDGLAQNWKPVVDSSWSPVGGEYRAQTAADDYMTSVYTGGQVWADASVQVDVRRTGDQNNAVGLGFRTSADLDADGAGTGYLFLVASNYYSIWWQDGATATPLQGWTFTTALRIGTATNRLLASAVSNQLRFYVNNTYVWTGSDTHGATGTIALLANTAPATPTTAFFDNVRVGLPRTDTLAMGRKQIYLNSRPQPHSDVRRLGPVKRSMSKAALEQPAELLASSAWVDGPFSITNLPSLPAVLAPGSNFTFDVIYAPQTVGSNENAVTLFNNDNNEPFVSVSVNGRAAAGILTGRVTAAHSGGPIAGAVVTAQNGVTNRAATTDTNGVYRLDLVIGSWNVTAAAANYTTGAVSGLVISNAVFKSQHFVLTGSQLTYGPTGIVRTLNWTARATNTVRLTNSGPLGVSYQVRAVPVFSGSSPVSIPGSDGNFPRGDAPPAAEPAPDAKPTTFGEPSTEAPTRVLCYGVDMNNHQLVSFYSDTPGTFTVIGGSGANLIPCVDFMNGDFSLLYGLDGNATQLIALAAADAARTIIGASTPAAGQSWSGIAADPDGALYAASTDIGVSKLYTVNPATGAATFIGDIANAPGIIAIAIDAEGQMYGLDIANDNLVRIDKLTGAGTVIGAIGFDANYAQGMDFDDDSGTLYLAAYNGTAGRGELRIADTATGNTALVGPFQGDAEMNIAVAAGGRVPWVALSTNAGAVAAGSTNSFDVVFDSSALPNTASTNRANLVFSGTFVNDVPDLPLTLIVVPDPLGVAPDAVQESSGFAGGPFTPSQFLYSLTNRSGASMNWAVSNNAAWLDVAPTNGTLGIGGSGSVTARLNAAAGSLAIGSYTARLAFVNRTTGIVSPRWVKLTVRPEVPDYFTQLFTTGNDLDGLMIAFRTNGSADFYEACNTNIAAFPTDPAGSAVLTLTDDSFAQVNLVGGAAVKLYGASHTNLFVGSNGYITFGSGDTDYSESLADHFRLPRISGLFDDLDPENGGAVSWTQKTDRVVVTFQDIQEIGGTTTNRFQFELFFDGTIRIAWPRIAALDGLAGLSQGLGVPTNYVASDLSAYGPCGGAPTDVTIVATVGSHGAINPAGAVVVTTGGSTNFRVRSDVYFHIADILTNSQSIGHAFGTSTTNYLFWWSNIVANGTVHGKIGANLAAQGTPQWWLAKYGWTQNFDLAETWDSDTDTFANAQEYLADTIPTNKLSYPRMQAITLQSVQFQASTARWYDVQGRTDLASGSWMNLFTNLPGTGSVMSILRTNQDPRLFYRFRVGLPPGE